MKKLFLLSAVTFMVAGSSFAYNGDGGKKKKCAKGKSCCSKEVKAEKKSCCKDKADKTAKM